MQEIRIGQGAGSFRRGVAFPRGSWAAKASVFYFCTSASLAHRTLVAEIETQALRLRERNIRFVSLGKEELSKALRNHPDIVEIFLGGYWADAFCARTGWQTDDVLTNLWRAPPKLRSPCCSIGVCG